MGAGVSARVGGLTLVVGALVLAAPVAAGASTTPVSVQQLVAVRVAVDPLVVRHDGVGLLIGAPGTATVSIDSGEVLVAADMVFMTDDRASGALVASGPAGDLRVLVEDDGADQRVVVHLTDGVGGDTVLDSAPASTPGLPTTAALRVEQHDGRMRVWLDGSQLIDRALTAPEVVLMAQDDHGVVVDHVGDGIVGAWVLARG